MTVAEVARTYAYRVPRGAELVGGPRDGLRVIASSVRAADRHQPSIVVFLLSDGSQAEFPAREEVAWLHPERRTAA